MNGRFSRKTFEYFEGARRNRKNLKWFLRNEELYQSEVKLPFSTLLNKMEIDVKEDFPGISFNPRKISLPVYHTENIPEDGTIVKPFTWAFLSEKKTSLFEWNPGINIFIGPEVSIGLGLYHPSARQMKLLRERIMSDHSGLSRELRNKKFAAVWGALAGERFIRFPRGFSTDTSGSDFLWHKQFIVTKEFSRKDILSPGFADRVTGNLQVGAEFLSWLRTSVGIYEKD